MKNLVDAHLERIPGDAFVKFQDAIKDLASKRYGVYALYKGGKLYYVGLAKNLKSRVQQHLKDRHKGKWDTFSLYLIRRQEHLKELETLVIHIAAPTGNTLAGKFARSVNLNPRLKKLAFESVKTMFGGNIKSGKKATRLRSTKSHSGSPSLNGLLPANSQLRVLFKGKEYTALVDEQGRITLDGLTFNSPSSAASHVTKGPKDGWIFWRFKNENGDWVKIDAARHK